MEPINVFLDDVRQAYPGWVLAKTADEVLALLRAGGVVNLSLDHDLGMVETSPGIFKEDPRIPDGTWLVKQMAREGLWPQNKPLVHSMNPPGAARMRHLIDRYFQQKEENL